MKTSDIFREVCKRMPENTSGITIMWTPDEDNNTELPDDWYIDIVIIPSFDTDGVRTEFYIKPLLYDQLISIGIMETFEKSYKAMETMGITIAKFMIAFDKYHEEVWRNESKV